MRPLGSLSPEQLNAVLRGVCLWLGIKSEF
jgi:hypothetical protein